jgi:hypothetical protein
MAKHEDRGHDTLVDLRQRQLTKADPQAAPFTQLDRRTDPEIPIVPNTGGLNLTAGDLAAKTVRRMDQTLAEESLQFIVTLKICIAKVLWLDSQLNLEQQQLYYLVT